MRARVLIFFLAVTALVPATPARAAPANDAFSSARAVTSLPFSERRSTTGATVQAGEKSSTCAKARATVWYRFTPREETRVAVSTYASSFDTVVAVFTGSTITKLKQVNCSNDMGTRRQSIAGWVAAAGTTYYVQVGSGPDAPGGTLRVRFTTGTKLDGTQSVPIQTFELRTPHTAAIAADQSKIDAGERAQLQICLGQLCFVLLELSADAEIVLPNGTRTARVCLLVAFPELCQGT